MLAPASDTTNVAAVAEREPEGDRAGRGGATGAPGRPAASSASVSRRWTSALADHERLPSGATETCAAPFAPGSSRLPREGCEVAVRLLRERRDVWRPPEFRTYTRPSSLVDARAARRRRRRRCRRAGGPVVRDAEHRDAVGAGVDGVHERSSSVSSTAPWRPPSPGEAVAAGREGGGGGEGAAGARSNFCTMLPAGSLVCVNTAPARGHRARRTRGPAVAGRGCGQHEAAPRRGLEAKHVNLSVGRMNLPRCGRARGEAVTPARRVRARNIRRVRFRDTSAAVRRDPR